MGVKSLITLVLEYSFVVLTLPSFGNFEAFGVLVVEFSLFFQAVESSVVKSSHLKQYCQLSKWEMFISSSWWNKLMLSTSNLTIEI